MSVLSDDFLWGGATAANQFEVAWDVDDKGPSVSDMCTNGSATEPKWVTRTIHPDCLYPSHEAIDFYTFSYYMSSCISETNKTVGGGNVIAGVPTPTSRHPTGDGRSIPRACAGASTRFTPATASP